MEAWKQYSKELRKKLADWILPKLPEWLRDRLIFWGNALSFSVGILMLIFAVYKTIERFPQIQFPDTSTWVIITLILLLWCAYVGTYRSHLSLKPTPVSAAEDLSSPKLIWEWRDRNTQFLIRDGNTDVSLIYLRNRTAVHIERIEVFCYAAIPVSPGDFTLDLFIDTPMPPRKLSRDEHVPIRVVMFDSVSRYFRCLLQYRGAQNERLKGNDFLMKLMVVGSTVGGLTIPSLRILVRFGISRTGEFYVSYENS
jgi:hypothetical protein